MENLTLGDEVNVGGRPSVYNAAVAERICELIANTNMGLRAICQRLELCYSTVYRWTMPTSSTYRPKFRRMYLEAKEMQVAALEEEVLELASDRSQDFMLKKGGEVVANPTNVARCRLEIAVKQWAIGRLATKNKEVPETEQRERQWWKIGDYFIDIADGGSTMAAWNAAMEYKAQEAAKLQAAAAADAPPPAAAEERKMLNGDGFGTVDISNVVELPADALKWDKHPEVVDEQIAALREQYPPRAKEGE